MPGSAASSILTPGKTSSKTTTRSTPKCGLMARWCGLRNLIAFPPLWGISIFETQYPRRRPLQQALGG